jgi:crossover junction endodeoxyribonuclease RuvC
MTTRVLGVDPGSAATGWALVVADGNRYRLEERGVLRPRGQSRSERLADLDRRFDELLARLHPDCSAVESSFAGRNPRSSLSLAECRGVLLAALGRRQLAASSYSPAEIKSAVVGHGNAAKAQIVYMVTRLLNLKEDPPRDAADAIAVALTHLHTARFRRSVDGPRGAC